MQLINPEIRIENTNFCNARCVICPREKMTRPKVFMPMYHFEYLVDQAKDLSAKLISIFGFGEPLLDKHIIKRVEYCSNKGLDTFITTNASLLNLDMTAGLLDAGLSKIRFSVHGIFGNYESVHQGLEYDKVSRNVSNFVAMNKARYDEKCDVSIIAIPMNGETVAQIVSAWRHMDIEIWKPHNWGEGRKYRNITEKRQKTCGRVHSGPVQIQADGKVIPCCFLTNGELILGNTYKNSIKDILKGKLYTSLRKKHESGDIRGLPCETCDQLNTGDAPLLYSTVDPACESNKTSSTKFKLKEK